MTDHVGLTDGSRRTIPVLRALAANPAGLSTVDLARQCAPDVEPWSCALSRVGGVARRQKAAGRVRIAGTVPGSLRNIPTILWQITAEGRSFLTAERRRTISRQREVSARLVYLLHRKVKALDKLEAGITELEQVEREMAEEASIRERVGQLDG